MLEVYKELNTSFIESGSRRRKGNYDQKIYLASSILIYSRLFHE